MSELECQAPHCTATDVRYIPKAHFSAEHRKALEEQDIPGLFLCARHNTEWTLADVIRGGDD